MDKETTINNLQGSIDYLDTTIIYLTRTATQSDFIQQARIEQFTRTFNEIIEALNQIKESL